MSPEAERLAAELRDEAESLRRANADAPPPPAEALELLKATGFPFPQRAMRKAS